MELKEYIGKLFGNSKTTEPEENHIQFCVPDLGPNYHFPHQQFSGDEPAGAMAMDRRPKRIGYDTTCDPSRIVPDLYQDDDRPSYNYQITPGHLGRIWFSLRYEKNIEKLHISLKVVTNLPARNQCHPNSCDPLIRVSLIPDDKRCVRTKTKQRTCNPYYDEDHVFPIPANCLPERTLKFTVIDTNNGKHHKVIGHVTYELQQLDQDAEDFIHLWRDLVAEEQDEESEDQCDLNVVLHYNSKEERLSVTVHEGRNFAPETVPEKSLSFYVKVCLIKQRACFSSKTDTVKKTAHPVFREKFDFNVSSSDLLDVFVRITAMQSCVGKSDKQVGQVNLGGRMFSSGKQLEHWEDMRLKQNTSFTQTHKLV